MTSGKAVNRIWRLHLLSGKVVCDRLVMSEMNILMGNSKSNILYLYSCYGDLTSGILKTFSSDAHVVIGWS